MDAVESFVKAILLVNGTFTKTMLRKFDRGTNTCIINCW
jgi:hypothetical protein